jgi:hypothetical protein
VLTVKSGLDPHMIIELEDGLKSCSLVILAIFLWCILPLCLMWVGIYLYFISNQVLIKFNQLKLLNAVNLSAFPCLGLCIHYFPTPAEFDMCSPLLYTLLRKRKLLHEDDVKMLWSSRRTQPPACGVWCLRFQD